MWKGLLHALLNFQEVTYINIPVEQIIDEAIRYVNSNNGGPKSKKNEQSSNENDMKGIIETILSNIIRMEVINSDGWTQMKEERAKRLQRSNRDKLPGKITTSTQLS